jgi:tetratricopeptide (TPR) repeat protein
MMKPCLIIIDEFQKTLGESGSDIPGEWKSFLKTFAARPQVQGKMLLLSNRTVKKAAWAEQLEVREVTAFSPQDGALYLDEQLRKYKREDEVPAEKRSAVINLLAGNPRAINLLISNLAYSPLQELINIAGNNWQHEERYLSPELVVELEKRLLDNILNNIAAQERAVLYTIAVLRKPFGKEVFSYLFSETREQDHFRKNMIDLFLLEHHRGWFNLNPIAREVGLSTLYNDTNNLREAHRKVARYYLRYFHGQRVEGQLGKLGGYFTELKYHLVLADDHQALKEISTKFFGYLNKSLSSVTPIPKTKQGVDELIMVLSGILGEPGPEGLENLLARLYDYRRNQGDLSQAIIHAERALNNKDAQPWILLTKLLCEKGSFDKAIAVLKRGISLPVRGSLFSLFMKCAELLKAKGETEEAIQLLREGIIVIPADKNLFSLYKYCAELTGSAGRIGEAIQLLRAGIEIIPADKNLVSLYQYCAELMGSAGRIEEAIQLLRAGIEVISADQSLFSLYQYCAELMGSAGRIGEAIQLLREGIAVIPADQNLFSLYLCSGELLCANGEPYEAVELMRKGIKDIPPNKGQSNLYAYCAEILWSEGQKQLAFAVLNDGMVETGMTKFNRVLIWYKALFLLKEKDGQGLEDLLVTPGIKKFEEIVLKGFISILWKDYVAVDELLRQYRTDFSRFNNLHVYGAYTLGLLEESTAAIELIRAIKGREKGKDRVDYWLMSCLFFVSGDTDAANEEISVFLGRAVRMNPRELKKELFDVWNRKSVPANKNQVPFYFPLALPMFEEYLAEDDPRRLVTKPTQIKTAEKINKSLESAGDDQFDVFLCHNNSNKASIKVIGTQLRRLGLKPWLDEWELVPGRPWQQALEAQIGRIKTAAVFVGPAGIGPWQDKEMRGFLEEFDRRGTPVIPVILPSCVKTPDLPMFLKQHHYIDFRVAEPDPYRQLIWGITGEKPGDAVSSASIRVQTGTTSKELLAEIRTVVSENLGAE